EIDLLGQVGISCRLRVKESLHLFDRIIAAEEGISVVPPHDWLVRLPRRIGVYLHAKPARPQAVERRPVGPHCYIPVDRRAFEAYPLVALLLGLQYGRLLGGTQGSLGPPHG